jgi:hypothetical protein
MILEDDEPDAPSLEVAPVSASVDAGADPAFALPKPIDLPSQEAWYGQCRASYPPEAKWPSLVQSEHAF